MKTGDRGDQRFAGITSNLYDCFDTFNFLCRPEICFRESIILIKNRILKLENKAGEFPLQGSLPGGPIVRWTAAVLYYLWVWGLIFMFF